MNKSDINNYFPNRRHPASGVFITRNAPTIVYVTVCTHNRVPWLDCKEVHDHLISVWSNSKAWSVGFYMIMPDHIHFFCAPNDLDIRLRNWMRFWKTSFHKTAPDKKWRWQYGEWDTRLRRSDNYHQKWEYVRDNPVRKELVVSPDEWPFQGELNELRW